MFLLGPGWGVGCGSGLILGYLMYRAALVHGSRCSGIPDLRDRLSGERRGEAWASLAVAASCSILSPTTDQKR